MFSYDFVSYEKTCFSHEKMRRPHERRFHMISFHMKKLAFSHEHMRRAHERRFDMILFHNMKKLVRYHNCILAAFPFFLSQLFIIQQKRSGYEITWER